MPITLEELKKKGVLNIVLSPVNTETSIDVPQKDIFSKLAQNPATQVFEGASKGLASTLSGTSRLGEKLLKGLGRAVLPKNLEKRFGVEKSDTYEIDKYLNKQDFQPTNTAQKIGFGVEQVAEFFAPVPGLNKAKAAASAYRGGKALLTGAEVAGRTALQTGELGRTEITAGAAAPIVGGVISKAGEALFNKLPKRFVQSALNQSKKELKAGKDVSGYVLENKKIGSAKSLLEKSKSAMDDINKQIDNKISSLKVINDRITRKSILESLEKTPEASDAKLDMLDLIGMIKKAVPRSTAYLDNKQLSVKNANELRKLIDKKLGDRFFLSSRTGTQTSEILYQLRKILSEKVKKMSNTEKLFEKLSNEITLSSALEDLATQGRNQIISFGDLIGAGLGTAVAGGFGTIPGIIGRRAVQSMPFLTSAGVTLNELRKAAPVLQKLTPAERGLLSQIIQKLINNK